jgi:hypothetical protein
VGAGGKKHRLGIAVLACALIGFAAAGRAAAAGLSPHPQPSPAHPTIQPQAAPGATAPQSSTTTGASTTSFSPSVTSASASPRAAVVAHRSTRTVSKSATKSTAAKQGSKADPPPKVSSRPIRELASWFTHRKIVATSVAAPASSSESLLLLLVGLGLVVLVLGETTLLRRAARPTAPQRAAEEPLPIRRVQLRR